MWLATRLVLALVAVFVMRSYELSFVEVVRRWDVEHFLGVARNGYANPLDVAFFPGCRRRCAAACWWGWLRR